MYVYDYESLEIVESDETQEEYWNQWNKWKVEVIKKGESICENYLDNFKYNSYQCTIFKSEIGSCIARIARLARLQQ